MPRITLPDGARGVALDGSGRYTARPGDTVRVSAGHADAIRKYAQSGPPAGERLAFGTKAGRWCAPCRRLWNAWNERCPRCEAATEPVPGRPAAED